MNAARRFLACLGFLPLAVLAADDPDPRRFTLRENQPEVAWFESGNWLLAPGYPKLGNGTTVTAQLSDTVSSRRFVPLPPGGSVTWGGSFRIERGP